MNTHSHPVLTDWEEDTFRLHIAEHHGAKGLFVDHSSVALLLKWHEMRHDNQEGMSNGC